MAFDVYRCSMSRLNAHKLFGLFASNQKSIKISKRAAETSHGRVLVEILIVSIESFVSKSFIINVVNLLMRHHKCTGPNIYRSTDLMRINFNGV